MLPAASDYNNENSYYAYDYKNKKITNYPKQHIKTIYANEIKSTPGEIGIKL